MARPITCDKRWIKILQSFERHLNVLVAAKSDTKEAIGLVHTALIKILQLHTSPLANGKRTSWKQLAERAEAENRVLGNYYESKVPFPAMCICTLKVAKK
jgi:hypothetical protein